MNSSRSTLPTEKVLEGRSSPHPQTSTQDASMQFPTPINTLTPSDQRGHEDGSESNALKTSLFQSPGGAEEDLNSSSSEENGSSSEKTESGSSDSGQSIAETNGDTREVRFSLAGQIALPDSSGTPIHDQTTKNYELTPAPDGFKKRKSRRKKISANSKTPSAEAGENPSKVATTTTRTGRKSKRPNTFTPSKPSSKDES